MAAAASATTGAISSHTMTPSNLGTERPSRMSKPTIAGAASMPSFLATVSAWSTLSHTVPSGLWASVHISTCPRADRGTIPPIAAGASYGYVCHSPYSSICSSRASSSSRVTTKSASAALAAASMALKGRLAGRPRPGAMEPLASVLYGASAGAMHLHSRNHRSEVITRLTAERGNTLWPLNSPTRGVSAGCSASYRPISFSRT
mmetsp:Transcript_6614/g.19948  ORF Transcript_6614/g.19948 Transcript_6614/m.19948 type:complete len:204 (+) Transcript_6614:415-1026(+)